MSKWLDAAQAIAQKTGRVGSAESARNKNNTPETGENRLYALYAPPTPDNFRVTREAGAILDRGQVHDRTAATIAPEQRAELRALVDAVAAFHGFTLKQTAEAQEIAQADQVAALECFRALAERDDLTIH